MNTPIRRILCTSTTTPNSLDVYYAKELARKVEVIEFMHQELMDRELSGVHRRLIYRLKPNWLFGELNRSLLKSAEQYQPDAILIFKGSAIWPSTVEKLRKTGSRLINYNADHPFQYSTRGSGNRNVLGAIPHYDLHVTYGERIRKEMQEEYPGCRTEVLPFGHRVSESDYRELVSVPEEARVCFVGNPDEKRACHVRWLLEAGLPVDVFGYRWDQALPVHPKLRTYPIVLGKDYDRVLRQYRVQINVLRNHNRESHNMRTFEVPAVGGVMLAEHSTEQAKYFEPEKEACYFHDRGSLIEQSRRLLDMSQSKVEDMRQAARRRSVEGGYHYADRAVALLRLMESIET